MLHPVSLALEVPASPTGIFRRATHGSSVCAYASSKELVGAHRSGDPGGISKIDP
jgi:hypothetical protein